MDIYVYYVLAITSLCYCLWIEPHE